MNKLILALALAPLSAVAVTSYDTARVESVTPQQENVRIQGQCRMSSEYEQQGYQSNDGIGGSILGGVVGGLLGSQVGGGSGKTVATAAGAIAGTLVGGNLARNGQGSHQTDRPRQYCEPDRWTTRTTGYLVTYEYRGQRATVVTESDPGRVLQMVVTAEPVISHGR
jgi:uncharacterized protein YcfJ